MTANTWNQCRDKYEQSETTWRKSVAERLADWSMGCGWCGERQADHAVVVPIRTADAVLAQPFKPVHPLVVGYLHGDVIMSRLSDEEFDLLARLVHLIPDDYPTRAATGGAP